VAAAAREDVVDLKQAISVEFTVGDDISGIGTFTTLFLAEFKFEEFFVRHTGGTTFKNYGGFLPVGVWRIFSPKE
jgi:hypothetical protein